MADYTLSSGNVFKDLGLPSPDERLAKAKLAYKINHLDCRSENNSKGRCGFFGNKSIENDGTEKRSFAAFYD